MRRPLAYNCVVAVLYLLLRAAPSLGQGADAVYDLSVNIGDARPIRSEIVVDAYFTLSLPSGTGLIYLPLPFGRGEAQEIVIDPRSDPNLLLCGWYRPTQALGACAATLRPQPSEVILKLPSVRLRSDKTAIREELIGLLIPLAEAYDETASVFGADSLARPRRLKFKLDNFAESIPNSVLQDSGPTRVIDLSNASVPPPTIILYAEQRRVQVLLYGMLGVLGVLLGFLGAPRLITSKRRAGWFLSGSALALPALLGYFFFVLPPEARFTDTTVVVTVGTTSGLLIGILISAAQLFRSISATGTRSEDIAV